MKTKLFKRILSAAAAAMLFVGMVPMSSFAASTIDTNAKGKLTIIKEYVEDEEGNYVKVKDVEFSYLKVADIEQLESTADKITVAFKNDSKSKLTALFTKIGTTPTNDIATGYYYASTIQSALTDAMDTANGGTLTLNDVIDFMNDNGAATMTRTDADGKTEATELATGLYLVVETSRLSTISKPCAPFFVSIPSNVTANVTTHENEYDTENWIYDVTAIPKNEGEEITIDKSIVVDENDADDPTDNDLAKADDYQIGDTVRYEIKADVPGSIEKLQNYYITDILSTGLNYAGNMKVWGIKADDDTPVELTKGDNDDYQVVMLTKADIDALISGYDADHEIKMDEDHTTWGTAYKGFRVDFAPTKLAGYKQVYIEFDALLTEDAVIGKENGNPNTVELRYSHVTSVDGKDKPTPPVDEDDKDDVVYPGLDPIVYTYDVAVTKELEGTLKEGDIIKFELQDEAGTPINVIAGSPAGTYYISDGDAATNNGAAETTVLEVKDGQMTIRIIGLSAGQYKLVEKQTATGHTLLKEPIIINIKSVMDTEQYKEDNDHGKYFKVELGKEYFADTAAKVKIDLDGFSADDYVKYEGTVYARTAGSTDAVAAVTRYERTTPVDKTAGNENTGLSSNYDVTSGTITFTVINKKGFDLPTTGGIGTYIFTIGGLLIMAAAVLLLTKRKQVK